MEVRLSRIISEYYDYTRKEAEEYIRQGRVTVNGEVIGIGDKAGVTDDVRLDGAKVPLKGVFKKVERENVGKNTISQFRDQHEDEFNDFNSPKSRSLRKGRKNEFTPKRKGKNDR